MVRLAACLLCCLLLTNIGMSEPTQPLCGVVLTPYGERAEDAVVALTTEKNTPSFTYIPERTRTWAAGIPNGREHYYRKTDRNGNFQFDLFDFNNEQQPGVPVPKREIPSDYWIYILHESGFRLLSQNDMEKLLREVPNVPPLITLEHWGRIEGTVHNGTKPAEGVWLVFSHSLPGGVWNPRASWHYDHAKSNENGEFVFEQVPPGTVMVMRGVSFKWSSLFTSRMVCEKIALIPAGTAFVSFGGNGRPVTGKLVKEEGFEIDWDTCALICGSPVPEMPNHAAYKELFDSKVPEEIRKEPDARYKNELLQNWETMTEEGKAFAPVRQEYETKTHEFAKARNKRDTSTDWICAIADDGTFRIDDLQEGDWQLDVASCHGVGLIHDTFLAKLGYRFTMEAIPDGVSDEPLDLGTLTVKEIK